MPPNIFPNQTFAGPDVAFSALLRRLVEVDQAFFIVEAYDVSNGVTKRRTPTPGDEYNFDNAAFNSGAFGFQMDSPGVGDWIVLQSTATPSLQVYWEYDSATNWNFALIPLGNFVTGGADVTPPVFPSTAIGTNMNTSPTLIAMALQLGSMQYSMWSDNHTFMILAQDGVPTNTRVMYVGAVDSGVPGDTRPFVINDTPATAQLGGSSARWNRLGVDGATFLSGGTDVVPAAASSVFLTTAGNSGLATPGPTTYHAFPAFVWFTDVSHRHFVSLKWSYLAGVDLSITGTLDSLSLFYFCSSASVIRWVVEWDGLTAV